MTMDQPLPEDYRIAIHTRPKDPRELSEVFQRVLQIHPTDAMVWTHGVPGILHHPFSADQAQELATAISGLGLRVSTIRSAELPDLTHAIPVHHARCIDSGLQIIGLHDEPEALIPWSAFQMVCVGETPHESVRLDSSTQWSLSAGHYSQNPGLTLPLTSSLEAWITCAAPFPNLRIHHEQMNYEYLGSRRVDSATANFKQFIHDLMEHATQVMPTESTRAYMEHVEPERVRFHSEEDLMRYATLHAVEARELSSAERSACDTSPD